MVWVRLADDFPHHPKILKAGPLAGWLWACGLAYANCYATDGFVPTQMVSRLIDVGDELRGRLGQFGDPRALALRLVDVGLWESVDGGFRIHDYSEYQPSTDEVKRERESAARRQADYRRRRAIARDAARNAESDALLTRESAMREMQLTSGGAIAAVPGDEGDIPGDDSDTPSSGSVSDALLTRESQPPGPGPARPGPVNHSSNGSPPSPREAFAPNERDLEETAKLGLDAVAISAEIDAMFDHYAAIGEQRADWHATFRGWLRKGVKFGRPSSSVTPSSRDGQSSKSSTVSTQPFRQLGAG